MPWCQKQSLIRCWWELRLQLCRARNRDGPQEELPNFSLPSQRRHYVHSCPSFWKVRSNRRNRPNASHLGLGCHKPPWNHRYFQQATDKRSVSASFLSLRKVPGSISYGGQSLNCNFQLQFQPKTRIEDASSCLNCDRKRNSECHYEPFIRSFWVATCCLLREGSSICHLSQQRYSAKERHKLVEIWRPDNRPERHLHWKHSLDRSHER